MKFRYVFKKLLSFYNVILPVTLLCLLVGYFVSSTNKTAIQFQAKIFIDVYLTADEQTAQGVADAKYNRVVNTAVEFGKNDALINLVINNEQLKKYSLKKIDFNKMEIKQAIGGTGSVILTYETSEPQKTEEVLKVFIAEYTSYIKANISAITDVTPNSAPVPIEVPSSEKIKNMIIAGVLGLIASCFAALIPYLSVDRVYSGADLEDIYAGKTLGVLPPRKGEQKISGFIPYASLCDLNKQSVKALKYKIELISKDDKIIALAGLKCKTDVVAAYLAALETEKKTLFIDANVYNSSLAGYVGTEGEEFAEASFGAKPQTAVRLSDAVDFISCGALKTLDGQKLSELIEGFSGVYDKIFIVCPPFSYEADCIKAMQCADAAFLAVAVALSKKKTAECLNSLEVAGVKLKGCFLSEL